MKRFLFLLLILPLVIGGCTQNAPDLTTFLEADKTEEIPYTDDFQCQGFAERLYSNAQKEGLKAGIVYVFFENSYQDKKYHALNVFDTENGLVFVDCSTGQDAIANIEIGKIYSTSYSQTTSGESSTTASIYDGVVSDYMIMWEH